MHCIKTFCLLQTHVQRFHRPKLETSVVDSLNDVTTISRADGVGLDDSKCKIPNLFCDLFALHFRSRRFLIQAAPLNTIVNTNEAMPTTR